MGQAAINAATNTHTQLTSIYPSQTGAQIWKWKRSTMMPGIDDYPKKTEVTSLTDAQTVLGFAQANGLEPAVRSGHPAGQRRLPGCAGQEHLLRHHAEHLGLQSTSWSPSPAEPVRVSG